MAETANVMTRCDGQCDSIGGTAAGVERQDWNKALEEGENGRNECSSCTAAKSRGEVLGGDDSAGAIQVVERRFADNPFLRRKLRSGNTIWDRTERAD
ncbi:hypothetical protein VTJ04DRAFT_4691 [Mycothermus thermophilus]|uniref:uncharacterized protein n=1 Tax=Humicola insolens TaxID=85995 RepID=UPI003742706D